MGAKPPCTSEIYWFQGVFRPQRVQSPPGKIPEYAPGSTKYNKKSFFNSTLWKIRGSLNPKAQAVNKAYNNSLHPSRIFPNFLNCRLCCKWWGGGVIQNLYSSTVRSKQYSIWKVIILFIFMFSYYTS